MKTKNNVMQPFSNGTSAMMWYFENCDKCIKSFKPKNGEYPSDSTMKKYCSIGKECKMKYALDLGHITGTIPNEIAQQIGVDENFNLKDQCMMFSDDEDDGFKYPKKPKPDNTPDNQMVLPFTLNEILENHEIKTEENTI